MQAVRLPSLRSALFKQITALLLVTVGFIGALTYWSARDQVGRTYDAELVSAADTLYTLTALAGDETAHELKEEVGANERLLSEADRATLESSARQRAFRVWRNGAVLLTSAATPPPPRGAPTTSGFRSEAGHNGNWRFYTLLVPAQHLAIEVGEPERLRQSLIAAIAVEISLPLMLLVPAAAALIWLSLGDGLRTLRDLAVELQHRSLRDLAVIDPRRWPVELAPLLRSVNQLFARLARAASHERRFIDEAAHQLRTPLAAIKLQTQLLARTTDSAEREQMLRHLQEGVNRAVDLGERLLALARLESSAEVAGTADLDAQTRQAMSDLAPFAALREVELSYHGEPVELSCEPLVLRMLASNLIDNAIRHSAVGTEVDVAVAVDQRECRLVVEDNGPGIPAPERERVFRRFQRGGKEQGGTGLGLSIVAEAVRVLHGTVQLLDRADGRSGLRVVVTCPH